jgi:hypothetical protein
VVEERVEENGREEGGRSGLSYLASVSFAFVGWTVRYGMYDMCSVERTGGRGGLVVLYRPWDVMN